MSEVEDFFNYYNFARAHRSYLINLGHTVHIDCGKREAEMSDGTLIPIGKTFKRSLNEKYDLFLRAKL